MALKPDWKAHVRAWVGPEKEGAHKGVYTCFVKAEEIDFAFVVDILSQHNSSTRWNTVTRIYLGAGRTDIFQWNNTAALATYCRQNKISVAIESSYLALHNALCIKETLETYHVPAEVICRFDDCRLFDCTMKLDNHKCVAVATEWALTDLRSLNESSNCDTFAEDTVIHENEK